MTREEAIRYLERHGFIDDEVKDMCIEALGNDTNVGSKLEKTEKFNRMIEAFECDFSLIQQGEKTFAQLDENLKVEKVNVNSLRKDMDLMQELSYLIRHGKAEIWLKEGE